MVEAIVSSVRASKFVAPGAHRIASTSLPASNLHTVAFRNPDGSKVLIAVNSANRSQTYRVRWGGQSLQHSLPAKSIATLTWGGTQAAPSAPAAPTSVAAASKDGEVRLKWEFSYLGATYNVKRANVSGGPYTTIATGVALPEYVDTSVTNGATYYYVVSAVNSKGERRQLHAGLGHAEPPADRERDLPDRGRKLQQAVRNRY